MRSGLLCLLIAAVAPLTSCGSLKRLGTDAAVLVTSPVTVPLSAVYDSLDWGEGETASTGNLYLLPFNLPLHMVKHVGYTFIHAVDATVSPFYLLASITPQNDLEPIGLYSLTDGYPWKSRPVPYMED